jgi:hypothetical protein
VNLPPILFLPNLLTTFQLFPPRPVLHQLGGLPVSGEAESIASGTPRVVVPIPAFVLPPNRVPLLNTVKKVEIPIMRYEW